MPLLCKSGACSVSLGRPSMLITLHNNMITICTWCVRAGREHTAAPKTAHGCQIAPAPSKPGNNACCCTTPAPKQRLHPSHRERTPTDCHCAAILLELCTAQCMSRGTGAATRTSLQCTMSELGAVTHCGGRDPALRVLETIYSGKSWGVKLEQPQVTLSGAAAHTARACLNLGHSH